ncbi:hypothetical protein SAMN05216456_2819 [Devosia crocina]|uniref:Uncharacterized protein n=1 Tax=Devosia crocina TaxID=429728 RepID=A0A1I7NRC1_9HYPH|nr:hypothetical protein SAMN05216456_2819 [Devosia crocina]
MSVSFQTIDDTNSSAAVSLLEEGFPHHRAGFWRDALLRMADYARLHQFHGLGTIMTAGGQPAGVLLTLPARLSDGRCVVNLSSWYVRQKYSWLAPRMLQMATSDPTLTYTDLTASHDAAKLNAALGFRTVTSATAFCLVPFLALQFGGTARIIPWSPDTSADLDPAQRDMLRFHRDLDCLCAVLEEPEGTSPLIFNRARWRGLPCARLLHVRPGPVKPALGAMGRFLLRSGVPTMTLPATADGELPIRWPGRTDTPVQVKGEWQGERVDAAYSEMAFLHL